MVDCEHRGERQMRDDDIDDRNDDPEDDTSERAGTATRREPVSGDDGAPSYEEEPGMGEDEHGEQPSQ
jgi:hypothetical protein